MQRGDLKKFKLPDEPGVYTFKKGRKILYIGKATSLSDRVRSYFSTDLVEGRGERIVSMVALADGLSWEQTGSVLEALILEAELIKRNQPPYNIDEKDNKSFNYVVITKEDFPRVLVVRGRELYQNWNEADIKYTYGPFPHGMQLQEAMKIVRRIFPYRDSKCTPCTEQIEKVSKKKSKLYPSPHSADEVRRKVCRACFNRQIGLCPGVCTGEVSKEQYAETVRNIKDLFSANFHGLKRRLAKEMQILSKEQKFEEAEKRRRQVHALEHIRDVSLLKAEHRVTTGGPSNALGVNGVRIEAYDVAHTSGKETVAVMTVVMNGEKYTDAYRKFKIHSATNDDTAALREVLSRRLNHPEWPLPRVFVIDGGKGQLNAAQKVLKQAGVEVPVVGVVKNEFHKPERLIGDKRSIAACERDILLANSEAHRFAINWHRTRRRKAFTS
jgi:excinuclease ABC subunit C